MTALPTVSAHRSAAAGATRAGPAIAVDSVTKAFAVPAHAGLLHPRQGAGPQRVIALDEVSLSVDHDEFIGIVGRNGSGKSTLLKCIGGIYDVDAGRIDVSGRLLPFLELGLSFHPDLSARDNALVMGTALGMTRGEAKARTGEVLSFAEIEEFGDVAVRNLSSGMQVRLAFAIAIQIDANVVLFDEVLAVADEAFREKCFAEFERLRGTRTVVLVTHEMDVLERFCDRAVLLDAGRIEEVGDPATVARRYQEVNELPLQRRVTAAPRRRRRTRHRGHRTHPPVAVGSDLRRFLVLSAVLAETAIKLRYARSRLGVLWNVLRPLLMFGVLYAVFTQVVRFGDDVRHYEVYLLSSIMLWSYFAETMSSSVGSLVARAAMLRRMRFPRLAIPFSMVLAGVLDLVVNLAVLLAFTVISGIDPSARWLELIPLVLVLVAVTTGATVLLSALFVKRRDVGPLWSVIQRGLFYGSAVLYPVAAFPDSVEKIMLGNPLVAVFTEARHALIDPDAPTAAAAIGGAALLAVPLGVTALLIGAGLWYFRRETPAMAENV